jgi:hypothetical protein
MLGGQLQLWRFQSFVRSQVAETTRRSSRAFRRSQGKVQRAREPLAPVYGWFTKGFDTRDLKEAKALLVELAAWLIQEWALLEAFGGLIFSPANLANLIPNLRLVIFGMLIIVFLAREPEGFNRLTASIHARPEESEDAAGGVGIERGSFVSLRLCQPTSAMTAP